MVKAEDYLLTTEEVREALRQVVHVEDRPAGPQNAIGEVLRAAAKDWSYRRFSGVLASDDGDMPFAVSLLVLVFASPAQAEQTFAQVAQAAHLRTEVDGCQAAVETVTAPGGMVSYWGFLHRGEVIMVLTLDSLSPQRLSMADLRSLVSLAARRLGNS